MSKRAAGSQRALEHLGKLQSSYTSFLSDLRTKLSSALPEELQQLWLTIFAPVSNQISRSFSHYALSLLISFFELAGSCP